MLKSRRLGRIYFAACLLIHMLGRAVLAQSPQQFESVIIQSPKPYTKLVADIRALGGAVKYQYKHVDGVAADVPSNAMGMLRTLAGSSSVVKDMVIPAPAADVRLRKKGESDVVSIMGRFPFAIPSIPLAIALAPAAEDLNNFGLNLAGLHSRGFTGAGVIVAVIDSGVQPRYPILDKDDSVIGGVDFVGDGFGFSNPRNNPHGTFVSGLISGNLLINIAKTTLETSLQAHFPGALIGSELPLIGTAPLSSIYAVRVFGADTSQGAPESRIIAAIDYVIDLRKKFDRNEHGGIDIQICNLSLGNTTFYAGRDVFDQSVDALLAAGIIPVVAGGGVGPSGLTVSSPATSLSAIAVGSASAAASERVQQDIENDVGYGVHYRPSSAMQVAWFSSRGPNADGRLSPSVIANGVGTIGQGYGSLHELNIMSGTSFSAPLISGVAAVLRQAYPAASPARILNAIVGSGDPSVAGPGFTRLDQGTGFPDAQQAFHRFLTFPGSLPPAPTPQSSVAANVKYGAGLTVVDGSVSGSTGNLAPGQRAEILYQIAPNTSRVVITVSNFVSIPNPSPQNLFPEELYFQVHSAKTSQIGALGDYFDLGNPFTTGGTFTVNNPEPGIMRITSSGSWTNQGGVSATVGITSFTEAAPEVTTRGTIHHQEQIVFPVTIPQGVSVADFQLWFTHDWGTYPASDLDMILIDPNLMQNKDGAHLNDPERAVVLNPTPGSWQVLIIGFDIPSGSDRFELRVSLDGKVVK